ncbi:cytochrome P450 [Streptomyces sp. NPDC023998]|uniref:cytochrome P450 n=1 Tax=Streptomyces sp. NPDC023998 TaxID=3154597 RepID=UPI0033C80ECA
MHQRSSYTPPDAGLTWLPELGYWTVEEPELCRAVLADDQFSSSTLTTSLGSFGRGKVEQDCPYLVDILSRWFVEMDPPEHTDERRMLQGHFSRGMLAKWESRIVEIVNEVLDGLPDEIDAVTEIAQPVSAQVIGLVMGLEDVDSDVLHGWSNDISRFLGAVYRTDYAVKAQWSVENMSRLIESQISSGQDNRLADIYQDCDIRQSVAAHTMVLFGGLETSARLIGQVIHASLSLPVNSPRHVDAIVEDSLRGFPPLKYVSRIAQSDVELQRQTIRAGDLVMVSLTGGRDVASPVLAFGMGRHFCLGMPLTMLETRILLSEFLRRFPAATIEDARARKDANQAYHGFESLPIRLGARSCA